MQKRDWQSADSRKEDQSILMTAVIAYWYLCNNGMPVISMLTTAIPDNAVRSDILATARYAAIENLGIIAPSANVHVCFAPAHSPSPTPKNQLQRTPF